MTTGAPRTLAEDLRARPDDALADLLHLRPDLLSPVPNDITQLATRAGTRASVLRAVERLDRFALQTAEALAVAQDPCPYETLDALMAGEDKAPDVSDALPGAVRRLRARALVWGPEESGVLHLVRTARELLSPPSGGPPPPTGLGPPVTDAAAGMSPIRLQQLLESTGLPPTHDGVSAATALAALFSDRPRMEALLASAPPESAELLDRLVWGPPYGTVSASPAHPVRWLLDRGLLLPTAPGHVVLPREAALHLRGGRAHRTVDPLPPQVTAAYEHKPATVDATAAGQALLALDAINDLLTTWASQPPSVLRAGGLAVRDLKRTAVSLDCAEPTAAFWVELAFAAGLVASDGEADERYAPTPAYDDWQRLPAERRWASLAAAWLTATRVPGLIGGRDTKGRALSALGDGLDRGAAPEVRRRVLTLLTDLPEGTAADHTALLARLRWERPLRHGDPTDDDHQDLRTRLAQWALTEAELLGVTARGALSSPGRAVLGGPGTPSPTLTSTELATATEAAARTLAPLLPEPLDHVLLQADLTAVAPGPLQRPLAETLGVLADIESKGGATVYRFTPASVRRALDAGKAAAELHDFLAAHSRTPVPQPLTYLIDDVARKHGQLRIGAASSYVRCDDDTLLSEILADRRSSGLRLRRLAPAILVSQTAPDILLERLREMGYAPAAESAEGDVLIARTTAHRTPPRTAPSPVPDGPPPPDGTLLTAAVRAIRAGDHAATAPHRKPEPVPASSSASASASANGSLPRGTAADTLATMQSAVLSGEALWIGYVNADGAASQRVIAPIKVEGGFVTAYDHTADEVRTYPLHRITGVAELDEA
ncbi:helicase C-terminal domain-containing protein [Streptomyces boninensis]|uniref:helicase C-terminal domain-containing protein n=1 Tax=Streptomyces boninensis TaxID=2039455 RepID=UPI003B212755